MSQSPPLRITVNKPLRVETISLSLILNLLTGPGIRRWCLLLSRHRPAGPGRRAMAKPGEGVANGAFVLAFRCTQCGLQAALGWRDSGKGIMECTAAGSLRLDIGRSDYPAPLFRVICDKFSEVGGRH